MQGKRPDIKPGTFGRFIKYLAAHYGVQLVVVFICLILSAFSSVIANLFIQKIVDEIVAPGLTGGFESVAADFIKIISSMIAFYLIGLIATFIYTRTMALVTQGTLKAFRTDMFEKMESLPIKFFDTHAHGDIMSTYTNDTDAIRQLIGQAMPMLIQSAISSIGLVVMMFYYSIWLTLVAAIFVFIMFKAIKSIGGKSSRYMLEQQMSLAAEEGFIEEMMEGTRVVKVFNHETESKEDFAKLNEKLRGDSEKANIFGNVLGPIMGNLGNLMYVVVVLTGGLLVTFNARNIGFSNFFTDEFNYVTIGMIVSFLSMCRQLSQTIMQASMQMTFITMGLAGAERVFDLIDQAPEEDEGYVQLVNSTVDENGNITETDKHTGHWAWKHPHKAEGTVTYQPLEGNIELADVDFGYNPEKIVLHNVSLYAKPGQKIAFVGSTGAGKTTITNLINRFYDIGDGKIRYDGININKINKKDLRRSLGIVLQDVNLFTGTVMDNIRYGKLDATDEECINAAKLANAHGFIERLPDGYNTMLTANGSNLSQGQRQLISIARAAVADPPAMILDEATSSIDTRTEAIVQRGMDNLMKGRTVFVIAHRLSTVRNSDAIMVLDHGRIIERGNHDELIAQKGTYYQLYTGAFEME
ncbi:MAG: ABC transporter ATP-binding protein/permease [Lachnospiraceae bacterium]|nr:ABC transporter ATP-binding protein/permease [Lachnospiraceae bacterium]